MCGQGTGEDDQQRFAELRNSWQSEPSLLYKAVNAVGIYIPCVVQMHRARSTKWLDIAVRGIPNRGPEGDSISILSAASKLQYGPDDMSKA